MDNKMSVTSKEREISANELNDICRNRLSVVSFDFDQDAKLYSEQPIMFLIGEMLVEFQRPPKSLTACVYSAEEAITEFFHQRDVWQRDLRYYVGSHIFSLGPGVACSAYVSSSYALDHIRFRQISRHNLRLVLPHPRKWVRVGLGWLFEPQCPCGEPRCVPAPWRNTICRNGY